MLTAQFDELIFLLQVVALAGENINAGKNLS